MMKWQPIETAPRFENVLVSTNEGVFLARLTNLAEDLMTDTECEQSELSEEDLFLMEWWLSDFICGCTRASDDDIVVSAWMPLPQPPEE